MQLFDPFAVELPLHTSGGVDGGNVRSDRRRRRRSQEWSERDEASFIEPRQHAPVVAKPRVNEWNLAGNNIVESIQM